MKHRLNLDKKDPNYILLKEIFKIMDSRESKQILASYGFKNLNRTIFAFKIIFIFCPLEKMFRFWSQGNLRYKILYYTQLSPMQYYVQS